MGWNVNITKMEHELDYIALKPVASDAQKKNEVEAEYKSIYLKL